MKWGLSPRVRGTATEPVFVASDTGLSPSVRGNRFLLLTVPNGERSIPARTGEPSLFRSGLPSTSVYPRAYGGTPCQIANRPPGKAVYPRAYGETWCVSSGSPGGPTGRSIPARTGKPAHRLALVFMTTFEVYPRAYGETILYFRTDNAGKRGLSPRVRGNPSIARYMALIPRSIPARTGEP